MTEGYDNTNSGLLFPANGSQVVRQGKIDIEGEEHSVIIVMCKTAKGNTVFEIHKQVGVMFEADADKDFDSQGSIDIGDGKMNVWARKKTSANGTPMTAISVARPKQERQSIPVVADTPDLDGVDGIPF